VSVASLESYRQALGDFIEDLPLSLAAAREAATPRETAALESIEGVRP
jgi:hypothetical protein